MAKYLKLIPLLIALALLAGAPTAVSGQDETTTIFFNPTTYEIDEDASTGTVTVMMTISDLVSYEVSAKLSTSDETATAGSDYTELSTTVTFPANAISTQAVSITITDDPEPELDEFFTVSLASDDAGVAIGGSATVTIGSDDDLVLAFDRDTYSLQETSGNVRIGIRVVSPVIACPYGMPFSVRVSTEDGSALSPQDYQGFDTTVNFALCQRRVFATQRITLVNDNTLEPTETFAIKMELPGSPLDFIKNSSGEATVSIRDDSERMHVGFEAESYSATETDGHIDIGIEVTRPSGSCPSSEPFSFRLTGANPEGTSGEFGPFDPVVKFDPCETRRVVRIPIVDDDILELTKTFFFRLQRADIFDRRIILSRARSRVTLTDTADDIALLGFDRAEYTVTEGASLDLAVDLSGDTTCPVEFPFYVSLGSAIPRGARSSIAKPASRVAFESCDIQRDLPIDTSDIAATAELRFELGRTSDLDSRISIGQATAAAYVVDQGGTTEAFEGLAADENNGPWGIWSDGQTAWISNEIDHKIYAYALGTKERDSDQDFDTLEAAENNRPTGIWSNGATRSNGATMWVADYDDGKIYAYQVNDKARDPDKDFDTLSSAGNTNPTGIWSDETTMWVADYEDGKIYAYNLSDKAQDTTKEFNTLATGNNHPEGIWSDGHTMWVANSHTSTGGRKIYAYDMVTRDRVEEKEKEKEFNSLIAAGQRDPKGIWSDGNIMWVVDKLNHKIYAYYFPAEPTVPVTVRRTTTTTTTTGGSPEIDETDPARPSAVSAHCVSAVVDPDGGEIELGDTISDRWVSGCPSVTRGGRLAKYYTFDLPISTAAEIALDSHLDDYLVLRSGGLSGNIVEQDDDDGPGNNSLISRTLKAGEYTIEATTFYADGVEADFILSVKAVPRILYDGPVADVAHADYAPDGPTMTVKLLPTLPMGTLEVTIEDTDGFGEGTGPLGGAQASGGSAGTVLLALPRTAWVQYDGITVETRESGSWTAHTQADEQAMLSRRAAVPDLSPVLLGLVRLIGKAEGALQLLQSLTGLSSLITDASPAKPDESVLDTIFRRSHANCVSQVTVPWLVQETETTGVRVSVPVMLQDDDYLSLAASFKASGNEPALAQLHDLLTTGDDAPACQRPELAAD